MAVVPFRCLTSGLSTLACTIWLSSQMMTQTGFSHPFASVCLMHMLIYEQNHLVCSCWVVYLTPAPRFWCWCRGFSSVLIWWLSCLPCSSWLADAWSIPWFVAQQQAVLGGTVSGGFWLAMCSSCSWVLTLGDSADDQLGFAGGKAFIPSSTLLHWSTAQPCHLGDSPLVCVCCETCSYPCELPVCFIGWDLVLWLDTPAVFELSSQFDHIC
jgi:hypothetical protein